MPLIKATLLTLPASSRTYSQNGQFEPVATWMINGDKQAEYQFRVFMINAHFPHVQHLFLLTGWNFSLDAKQGDEKAEYEQHWR